MTTADRLARLRDFYLGVRGPYDGIADDIGYALDRLGALEKALTQISGTFEGWQARVIAQTVLNPCHLPDTSGADKWAPV